MKLNIVSFFTLVPWQQQWRPTSENACLLISTESDSAAFNNVYVPVLQRNIPLLGLQSRSGGNWGHITWKLSALSPKRDRSSQGVNIIVCSVISIDNILFSIYLPSDNVQGVIHLKLLLSLRSKKQIPVTLGTHSFLWLRSCSGLKNVGWVHSAKTRLHIRAGLVCLVANDLKIAGRLVHRLREVETVFSCSTARGLLLPNHKWSTKRIVWRRTFFGKIIFGGLHEWVISWCKLGLIGFGRCRWK